MLQLLVVNFVFNFCIFVIRGAWVEIPQASNHKPTLFIFDAPKTVFPEEKFPVTTPTYNNIRTSYKQLMKTAATTAITYLEPQIDTRMNLDLEATPAVTPEHEQTPTNPTSENATYTNSEPSNYSGFFTLLNNIQRTLTLNTKKNLKSKISVLVNLRDTLLANIDERMANLWQRSSDLPEARGHDDHEVDFPSNEGALMTIGFLTFAVFLIKLVLKLIHALKYKQNNSQMMMPMTTSSAAAFVGRKKRDLDDYDSLKILQMINDYTFT